MILDTRATAKMARIVVIGSSRLVRQIPDPDSGITDEVNLEFLGRVRPC